MMSEQRGEVMSSSCLLGTKLIWLIKGTRLCGVCKWKGGIDTLEWLTMFYNGKWDLLDLNSNYLHVLFAKALVPSPPLNVLHLVLFWIIFSFVCIYYQLLCWFLHNYWDTFHRQLHYNLITQYVSVLSHILVSFICSFASSPWSVSPCHYDLVFLPPPPLPPPSPGTMAGKFLLRLQRGKLVNSMWCT